MRHQKRPQTSSTIALISTAVLLLLALWGLAFAGSPEAEFTPRGQRIARDIKYGDWRKVCFQTPGTKMVCRTTISGIWETGQSAVRVDLIERQGEGAARLQLFLPVGLYLQVYNAALAFTTNTGEQRGQARFVFQVLPGPYLRWAQTAEHGIGLTVSRDADVTSGVDVVVDAFVVLCDTWPTCHAATCSNMRPQHRP